MHFIIRSGSDIQRVTDCHQPIQMFGRDKFAHGRSRGVAKTAQRHAVLIGLDGIRHAHSLKARPADHANPLAPDMRLAETFRQQNEILKFSEVTGHDGPGLPDAVFTHHIIAGQRRRMAAGGAFALRRAPSLVKNHLLARAHGITHSPCKKQAVQILESLSVYGDDVHFRGAAEMAHHVPKGKIRLVPHGDQIRGPHFRSLAETVEQKGSALADHGHAAGRIVFVPRQFGRGDEPGVVTSGAGNNPHAVGPQKHRAAIAAPVGGGNTLRHAGGHFPAVFRFSHAAGDQHDAVRRVSFDDFIHHSRNPGRADRHDEQIQRLRQCRQIRHATHAFGIRAAFPHNTHLFRVKPRSQNIFQNNTPEVPPGGGNAHNSDAARVQQPVYCGYGAARRALSRQGETAHAVQRNHQIIGEGERIDFQLINHKRSIRITGGKMIAQPDKRFKTFDELVIRDDPALPPCKPGQLAIGNRFAKQFKKRVSVRHFRERGHYGLPLAEAFGIQFRIRSPQPRADHHAELAGTAQAHNQFVAKGRRIRRHELHLEHPLQIARHGIPQRRAFQPPVCRRRGVLMTLDPFGVTLGHFRQHTPDSGTDLVRCFRHNAHSAHFRLVDNGRRHDLEHGHISRQRHDLFLHRAGVFGQKYAFGRSFRPRKRQQIVYLILIQEIAPFLAGVAKHFRYGLVFYSQIHEDSPF